ncbi:hypothetical protein DFQ28_002183 [Apophysomyces sp. BC1034]|nr:hypothetical protein DFQ30_002516 [Apophysomyces sp. BC1015]KAG0179984.1 hypothetical protein DFQ29_001391 [Apophysomyces sp. BC1021]KAG0190335.1 hypothetical protein DFQ28_002183 [Apophysomyces sp. BC1034]
MTPDEVVLQLKRKGTFDELRKHLLTEFQTAPTGQKVLEKVNAFMEDMVNKDPSLTDKDGPAFHELVTTELERAGVYKSIRDEVLGTLLQTDYYQRRVDEEMRLLITKDILPPNNKET